MITIATNMAGVGRTSFWGTLVKTIEAIEADESISAPDKEQKVASLRSQWAQDHEFGEVTGRLAHHCNGAPRIAPH